MKKIFILIMLVSVLPILASAQVSEQVSESRSYLQFFDAITADRANQQGIKVGHIETPGKDGKPSPIMSMPAVIDPNGGPSERQHAYLKNAGLSEKETVTAQEILAKFRIQYDALVAEYNNLPETLAGTNNATPAFLSRLDNLTQSTKYALGTSLSAEGMANLDHFIPRVTIKSQTVKLEGKSGLTSVAFHPGSAGQTVVDGGCTLTSNYTVNNILSASFPANPSMTMQITASSTTTMSGYASVSGSCGGLTVAGRESNYLGVGSWSASGGSCTITSDHSAWFSPTSWLTLNNVVDRFESVGLPAQENWSALVVISNGLQLLNIHDSKWHEFAYSRTLQPAFAPKLNCSLPTGRVCDFENNNYCFYGFDMVITSVRYDWTLNGVSPPLVGWEVWGEVFSLTGHKPWFGGTNLLQFAWPPYYSVKGPAYCTDHP